MKAFVPLRQHIGAPAVAVVQKGDTVTRGQLIAEGQKFISASVHAPISGTVTSVEPVVMPNGKKCDAIIITASEEEHNADTENREAYWHKIDTTEPCRLTAESLSDADIRRFVARAGIVGLGGAVFPSHVKFPANGQEAPEVLIINACECEPYLMCDDALMCRYPAHIVEGVELMLKASGAARAVIALENNKPEAAAALRRAIEPGKNIELCLLKTKYPQGGEKQLVEAVTGRRIASGALPLSVGALVNNVATAFAVWQAVVMDMPLIERIVTVTGDIAAEQRRNYIAATGTPLSELPFTLPAEARVIVGGPMMGSTAVNLDAPVTKGTSGITILEGSLRRPALPCVRCGACVDVCPMGLEPYLLSTYGRLRMWDEARQASVSDCLECGACSYSCPSWRPLLDFIRIAKQRSR